MKTFIVAALLASAVATPAFAQTSDSPFTGLRVEGIVGYDKIELGSDDDTGATTPDDGDNSIDGVVYGVQGGFDFDLGGVVVGIEGEFADSSGELDETEDSFGTRAGRDLYVGGRIGFAAGDRALIYAKGGYINTSIELSSDEVGEEFELDAEADGYRLGAGAEFLFSDNVYGKVEYRYSNYSSITDNLIGAEEEIDLDRHQVVAGIGFRF